MGFVLYGGTAVALYCGHRESKDFDFFTESSLDKVGIRKRIAVNWEISSILQDEPNTFSFMVNEDRVKFSFSGTINFGRVGELFITTDKALVVASPIDLMATKLAVIFDRIEAKDYSDISALCRSGVSLELGLAAVKLLYPEFPEMEYLRALTYFKGGDLDSLNEETRAHLREMSASVRELPQLELNSLRLGAIESNNKPSGSPDGMSF